MRAEAIPLEAERAEVDQGSSPFDFEFLLARPPVDHIRFSGCDFERLFTYPIEQRDEFGRDTPVFMAQDRCPRI